MNAFLYLILGLALGGLVGWLLRSLRASSGNPALETELREQLRGKDTEIADLRARHQAQIDAMAEARVEAERARSELKAEATLLADARAGAEERKQTQANAEAALRAEREANAGLQEKVNRSEEHTSELQSH